MRRTRAVSGCLVLLICFSALERNAGARGPSPLAVAIEKILSREVFAPALVAIDIRDLDTGKVLFERNAAMNVKPASTMKLFTTAAILDAEGGEGWKGETTVETEGRLDSFGRILGDVHLVGRGDPNLSDRVEWGDQKSPFDRLALDLRAAGVTRIEGRLIGHDGLFPDGAVPDGWTADDLVWSYGAEISALSAFDNKLELKLEPGELEGDAARLAQMPATGFMRIESRVTTGAAGAVRNLRLTRALGTRQVIIEGAIPLLGEAWSGSVATPEPALFATTLLAEALARQGITVRDAPEVSKGAVPAGMRSMASLRGPDVGEQIRIINKESQNLHAETLLRRLGLDKFGDGSVAAGLRAREEFLRRQNVRTDNTAMADGSGLSRVDLVTARAEVDLLVAMAHHPQAKAFRDSLPIAGVDGTLKDRMKGARTEGRVFAKTGSLRHVNALAGYVDAVSGRHLVFAIVVNHHTRPPREAAEAMDEICALLAALK